MSFRDDTPGAPIGVTPRSQPERQALAKRAHEGDAAEIAEHLLAEQRLRRLDSEQAPEPDLILGRTEDLLAQQFGEDETFIGWVAALANGVIHAGGIETWSRQAVRDALRDRSNPIAMWSEVRRGDLVVGTSGGLVRTAVALDGTWCIHLGDSRLEKAPLVDLFDPTDQRDGMGGIKILKDKLWFWASYGAPEIDLNHNVTKYEEAAPERPHPGSAALWLAAAAMLSIVALLFGQVVIGGGPDADRVGESRRTSLFPTSQLEHLAGGTVGEALQLCILGAPMASWDGEFDGIEMDRWDVYYFDDDTVMVEVAFEEPLSRTLVEVPRRLVRGYRVDSQGNSIGSVSSVEVVATGTESRGQYDLTGREIPGGEDRIGVDETFQFYLDIDPSGSDRGFRVGVDSMGEVDGALDQVCQVMVTREIRIQASG